MKKILFGFVVMTSSIFAQDNLIKKIEGNYSKEKEYKFEVVKNNKATSVKNQGSTGTCWSYATTSFIESEMLRQGKTYMDLSEMYTVRKVYSEKANKYVRMHGKLDFAQGGALHDMIDVMRKYGVVPQEVYNGLVLGEDRNNHNEMEQILKGIVKVVIKNSNGKVKAAAWKNAYESSLDAYLGKDIKKFKYKGKSYTPKSFAKEMVGLNADDYVQITSFSHLPLYKPVVLSVPDNWAYGVSYNVEMKDMTTIVDYAIKNGYTVTWATDVSERFFSAKNGIAVVPLKDYNKMSKDERTQIFKTPKAEKQITPEMRQEGYDNYLTQDDHAMHITGIAKDQNGKEYYIVKNSWGKKYNKGYLYVSKAFFNLKTISFLLHKNGLPKTIKSKIKI